jgi:hypothetical protein
VTGGTIKDGVIYDRSSKVNNDKANTDLVNAMFEMRNFGTFSNGQPKLVQGAITANDMQGFIARYKDNKGALDMGILNSALDTLQKQQA